MFQVGSGLTFIRGAGEQRAEWNSVQQVCVMWERAVAKEDQFLLVDFLHGVCVCIVCGCVIVLLVACSVYTIMCVVDPYILSILCVSLCLMCVSMVCDCVTCCMGNMGVVFIFWV